MSPTDPNHTHVNFSDDTPIEKLLERNEKWAKELAEEHKQLFPVTGDHQTPKILWFGCSDSRVPETTIMDLLPGEVFVHRNIANVLPSGDLNSQCVLEYAVVHLKVKHIIVCGHYGCGGVASSLITKSFGILDFWLKDIKAVYATNMEELQALTSHDAKCKRLVELNVITQVHNVLRMKNVRDAINSRGLKVHGFVYDVNNGKITNLDIPEDKGWKAFELVNRLR